MQSSKGILGFTQQPFTQCNTARQIISTCLLAYLALPPSLVWALPQGEAVSHGSATFERSGNSLVIKQGSDKLITQWGSFSIANGETTRFEQPNANSAALNRVVGGSRSILDGRLEANGKVILINPAGITVGPTGVINVNSLTFSTHDVSDADFLGGGELLYQGTSQESIENHGVVHAAGGDAVIIAKHLVNHGSIEAPNGTVALAAGTDVLVRPAGESRISIRPGSEKGATVTQGVNGRVKAAAAEIKAAGNPYALAINLDGLIDVKGTATTRGKVAVSGGNTKLAQTGTIKARTATGAGGEVTITNSKNEDPNGKIEIAGTLDVAGESGEGGQVAFRASLVELETGSLVDASSATGNGGRITIGGEFQGGIDPAENADAVIVEEGAVLKANAGTDGNGGTIIVWSDHNTFFYGDIEARGGSESGNGGFAEVSGKEHLSFSGTADLGTTTGELGTLLLDPTTINIVTGSVTAITSPYVPGTDSTIGWDDINAVGANVTISTFGAGGVDGDINIAGSGSWLGTGTLTLQAFRDINFGAGVVVIATETTGSFDFQAGNDFTMSAGSISTAGGGTGTIHIATGNDFVFTGGRIETSDGNIHIESIGDVRISDAASTATTGARIRAGGVGAAVTDNGALIIEAGGDLSITQNQYFAASTALITSDPGAFVVGSLDGSTTLSGDNVTLDLTGNSFVGRFGATAAVSISATNGDLIITGTEAPDGTRTIVGNRSTGGVMNLSATNDVIIEGESNVGAVANTALTITAGRDFIMRDGNNAGDGGTISGSGTATTSTVVVSAVRNANIRDGAFLAIGTFSLTAGTDINVLGRGTLFAYRADSANTAAYEMDLHAVNGNITLAAGATLVAGIQGTGDLRLLASGDITITDQVTINTKSATTGNSSELRLEAENGEISITGQDTNIGISGTTGSGTINFLAAGDITLERTTDLGNVARSLFNGAASKVDEPTAINITSETGDIRVLGTYYIGLSFATLDQNRVGDINLTASQGSITIEGKTLANTITNQQAQIRDGAIHLEAESIAVNEHVWLYSHFGDVTLTSTVDDITFTNTTTWMQRIGTNSKVTTGVRHEVTIDSVGSILVNGNVAFIGQTTTPTFGQNPAQDGTGSDINLLADDDITFGAGNGNVATYGGGDVVIQAGRDGTGSVEFTPMTVTVFPRVYTHQDSGLDKSDIAITAADDIRMVPITANANPGGISARVVSDGGAVRLTAQNGDVELTIVRSGSGNILIEAPNGSILDAQGSRTMNAMDQANIISNSGDITLRAAVTVGQGNLVTPATPIATTREIKIQMGNASSLQASSLGSNPTEGVFLSAFGDLLIGSPSTGITAVGDIVVKATNNLYVDGKLFTSGAGRSINLLSNSTGTNNTSFLTPTTSGDIILNGGIETTNGNVNLLTGLNLTNGSILDSIAGSLNDIRYIPSSTDEILSGSGDVILRANRNIGLGRIVTNGGDITVIAGQYSSVTNAVTQNTGQIFDVFPLELRDGATADSANINTLSAAGNVTLLGGSSVGLLTNGQDIDLALASNTNLRIRSWGNNTAGGDGVYLSYFGNFSTDQANTSIISAANLSIQVTGNMEIAAGSSLFTLNNGSIWLTALGITGGTTSGDLLINAAVTANGTGDINIVAVGRVLVNSTVSSTSGDISIIGAGRAESDGIGVDVTASGLATTGGGGVIHLASLTQQTAASAIVATGTSGQVRVGDVVINGVTATSVQNATYLQGTSYGEEVISGGSNSIINGVTGQAATATTSQQATISGGNSNGAEFSIDAAGNVIINTNTSTANGGIVTSTGQVAVSVVEVTGANTSVSGGSGAKVETTTGSTASMLTGGTTGTITINGVVFSMAGGIATVNATGTATHTLVASGGTNTFTSGDVSSIGGTTTVTSGNASTSAINSGASGTIATAAQSTGGVYTTIAAGAASVTFNGGSIVSTSATTTFDNAGVTTTVTATGVGPAADSTLTVGTGSATLNLATTITASGGTVVVDSTSAATVGGVTFGNLGTVVLNGTSISVGAGTNSVSLGGAASANLDGATASAGAGSVVLSSTTGFTSGEINTILNTATAATGGIALANGTIANNTLNLGTDYNLVLTGNTFASSGGVTGITVATPTTGANGTEVSVNRVVISSATGIDTSTAVAGNITSIGGTTFSTPTVNPPYGTTAGAQIVLSGGGTITVDGNTYDSNTPPTNFTNWVLEPGSTVYRYNGAGAKTVSNVTVNTAFGTRTGLEVNVTAPGVAVSGNVYYDNSTGNFYTDGITLAAGQFQTAVKYGQVQLTSLTSGNVSTTGGSTLARNFGTFDLDQFAGATLTNANLTANASASFTNVSGFSITSGANVSTKGTVVTSSYNGVASLGSNATYAGSLISNSLNTVAMANPLSGSPMSVESNGALVNLAGISSFVPTGASSSSNASVRIAERTDGFGNLLPSLDTAGGNIYVSAAQDALITQLDARNGVGLGGDIFIEATNGSIQNALTGGGTKNLLADHATLVGGTNIGTAVKPLEMDVASVYLDGGAAGSYLRQTVGRDLQVAGVADGEVAIVNDRQIIVDAFQRITFGPAVGINFTDRRWSADLAMVARTDLNAGTQDVFLRANAGANGNLISDNGSRVIGGNIFLDATGGVGESTTDRLLTNGVNIWFNPGASVYLSELNAATVGGNALATGAEIDIVTESLGDLTVATTGPDAHPITGTAYAAISGLHADENVTLATHSGRIIANEDILSDDGDIDLTSNFNQTAGDFGVLLNADVLALGERVRVLANNGDIWRTAGVIRAGDVQIRTNLEGAIGFTNGTESAVFTEAPLISFNSIESASLLNAEQTATIIGGLAVGGIHVVNEDGLLTVQNHTNFTGTNLATAIDETRAGVVSTGDDVVIINEAGNVQLNDVTTAAAGASDVSIWSQQGSIFSNGATTSQVTGNVVTLVSGPLATHTIGLLTSRIFTEAEDLIVDTGSDVFINELDGTNLAGITHNDGNADVLSGGTIRVENLDANFNIGSLVYNPAAYYGIHANGSGYVTLDANGASSDVAFAATARSDTGTVTILADRNLTDEIVTDITDGLNSNSLLLNIATGGDIILNAGVNIGDKGDETIDVAAGGTINATSLSFAVGDGTYLSVLGDVVIGGNTTINSARNIDVTTYARANVTGGLAAQLGDLTVAIAMNNLNAGYTRLNASRNLTVNAAINRGAIGDVILQTRSGDIDSNGTAIITADSLILESFDDAGVTNALDTAVTNLTFSLGGDLRLVEADGLDVSGEAENVNLTSTTGDIRVNDLSDYQAWDLTAVSDDINDAANPANHAFTGANSGIRANLTLGGIVLTATAGSILDAAAAEDNNLTAFFAVLNANADIGLDPMFDTDDLNTELTLMAANTTTGSVNIWERDGILVGNTSVADDFRLNTGGFIGQVAGTTITVADEVELDTERATTLGDAFVQTAAPVDLEDSRVRGNYEVVNTGGATTIDGDILVAGFFDVGDNGVVLQSGASIVGGAFTTTGGFTYTGGTLQAYGGSTAVGTGVTSGSGTFTVVNNTLVVDAFGSGPDFNLSVLLDAAGSQIAQYTTTYGSFDTIQVNLSGTSFQLPNNNLPADEAIRWDGTTNSMTTLIVRTGPVITTPVASTPEDYNLVQTAAVNTLGRNLIINGAVGTNVDPVPYNPVSTSTAGLVANDADFNSFVELTNVSNSFGIIRAYNTAATRLREAGTLSMGESYINGNLDAQSISGDLNIGSGGENTRVGGTSRLVAVGAGADVSFAGNTTFEGNALAAAGMDLRNSGTLRASNNLVLIADENAGSSAGGGWFRNTGSIISTDAQRDLAIYAAGGPLAATDYSGAVGDQVIWGTIIAGGVDVVAEMQNWTAGVYGGSNLNHKYATSYQGGGAYHGATASLLDGFGIDYDPDYGVFGSPVIWYKDILSFTPNRPTVNLGTFFFDLEQEEVETTQIGDYSEYERHPDEFEEDFLRQKSFGVFYQREAFRRAAKAWAPDPANILHGHFTDQRYFLQGRSLMRSYRTDRFHSEFVKNP